MSDEEFVRFTKLLGHSKSIRFAVIRIWWHCLLNFHCQITISTPYRRVYGCLQCGDILGYTSGSERNANG